MTGNHRQLATRIARLQDHRHEGDGLALTLAWWSGPPPSSWSAGETRQMGQVVERAWTNIPETPAPATSPWPPARLIHMHMLDADSLRIAVPQTP